MWEREGEGTGKRVEGRIAQCSPISQNFPSQPSLQKHCHGSSQSPLTQPGEVTHFSHRGPSQPGSHLCGQRGEREGHMRGAGVQRLELLSAEQRTLGGLCGVPGQWLLSTISSHLNGKLREGAAMPLSQYKLFSSFFILIFSHTIHHNYTPRFQFYFSPNLSSPPE